MTTPTSNSHRYWQFALCTLAIIGMTKSLSLSAQDPFGDPFGGAATPVSPTSTPPATGGTAQAAPGGDEDPLIKSVISAKPSSPAELLRAVEILMDYGRLDVAKTMFDQLNALTLTPAQQAALHDEFRSGLFLRISREPRFQPSGASFAKGVLDAAKAAARDPDRITRLIGQLSDPNPTQRHTALVDLREGQDAAVNAMLQVLGDASRTAEHRTVRDALVAFLTPPPEVQFRNATLPLTEMVVSAAATSDLDLLVQVMAILARLSAREATPWLVRPALAADSPDKVKRVARQALLHIVGALPTPREAEIYLDNLARKYLADQQAAAHDLQSTTAIWEWDDAQRVATTVRVDLEQAALLNARHVTRELHLLDPNKKHYRNLYLATALQTEKILGGLSEPLTRQAGSAFEETATGGATEVLEVFDFALRNDQIAGAIGAVEVLGEIGTPSLLATTDGRPGLLTQMLLHQDRRMRYTAAQAVLRLDPRGRYPGSSYLAETLAYLASTGGTRRVLIAHPRTDYAQFVVGLLRELGIDADTAATGNQTIKLAHASPDYEFILISDAIDRPAVSELIQQLRRDPRSRTLPIGVMTRQETARSMEHLVQSDPLAIAFPRLHSTEGIRIQTRRLLETAGRGRLLVDERMEHAEFALKEIARLASQPEVYAFYDLIRHESAIRNALANSLLTDQAAQALGLLATADSQRTLLEVANQMARPILDRQAASKAFETSVQRRGVLLTRNEILAQYGHYNASANADVETQQVLGSILDAIEAPTQSQPDADPGIAGEE